MRVGGIIDLIDERQTKMKIKYNTKKHFRRIVASHFGTGRPFFSYELMTKKNKSTTFHDI